MQQTILQFPEIKLERRDGHKLRGYFANLFGKESDLFHNHGDQGQPQYRYSKIQYKVVNGRPMMMGIGEGATLIVERFLKIKEINIDDRFYTLQQKHLTSEEMKVSQNGLLYAYEFVNPWMPLNDKNFSLYLEKNKPDKEDQLKGILINNMISFCKAVNYNIEKNIMVHLELKSPRFANFKNQRMLVFSGKFITNLLLPNYIGLGKSVARGYGTIIRK